MTQMQTEPTTKKKQNKKKTSNVKFHLIGYNGLQTMATASNNLPNATQNI